MLASLFYFFHGMVFRWGWAAVFVTMSDAGSNQSDRNDCNILGVGIGGLSDTELSGEEVDRGFDSVWQDAADIEGLFHVGESTTRQFLIPPLDVQPCRPAVFAHCPVVTAQYSMNSVASVGDVPTCVSTAMQLSDGEDDDAQSVPLDKDKSDSDDSESDDDNSSETKSDASLLWEEGCMLDRMRRNAAAAAPVQMPF